MTKGSLVNKQAGAAGLIRKEREERYHIAAEDAQAFWMTPLFFHHIPQYLEEAGVYADFREGGVPRLVI